MTKAMLSEKEQQRYQRHIQLPGFSREGQEKLKSSRVLIIGMGGLGCPAAQYLAAAGVGTLTLVDGDHVSLSNLQRQPLYTEQDLDNNKARVASQRLQALNPNIAIHPVSEFLSVDTAQSLIAQHDIVIDCTDNFHTRYLINDMCIYLGKPWVFASVLGFSGQLACFLPKKSCFRCVFPEAADVPDCNQAGVLGAVPGVVGTMQALEAIKCLCQLGKTDQHRLYLFSALSMEFRPIVLQSSPACPVCRGEQTFKDRLEDYRSTTISCLSSTFLVTPDQFHDYSTSENVQLVDVRSPQEHAQHNLGGVNIPLDQWDDAQHLRPEVHYLFYCQSGMRSEQLVRKILDESTSLDKQPNIKSLQGGINALSFSS